MERTLLDLEDTIKDIELKTSETPDPYLIGVLEKLKTMKENQQVMTVKNAEDERPQIKGGFKGFGIT